MRTIAVHIWGWWWWWWHAGISGRYGEYGRLHICLFGLTRTLLRLRIVLLHQYFMRPPTINANANASETPTIILPAHPYISLAPALACVCAFSSNSIIMMHQQQWILLPYILLCLLRRRRRWKSFHKFVSPQILRHICFPIFSRRCSSFLLFSSEENSIFVGNQLNSSNYKEIEKLPCWRETGSHHRQHQQQQHRLQIVLVQVSHRHSFVHMKN